MASPVPPCQLMAEPRLSGPLTRSRRPGGDSEKLGRRYLLGLRSRAAGGVARLGV